MGLATQIDGYPMWMTETGGPGLDPIIEPDPPVGNPAGESSAVDQSTVENQVLWLDDDQQEAWRALVEAHGRLLSRLDLELQSKRGLSLADYQVLVHLSEAPFRALRMAELAERLQLTPGGLTRRLNGLVKRGLVERKTCPEDRRGSLAAMTPCGFAALAAAAPTHVAGVRRYVVDPLTRDQLLSLGEALRAIDASVAGAAESGPSVAIRAGRR
jgi:DNA-binding MarR family transcriptional regulator